MDVSGSQRTVLAEQRRASGQFFDKVLRKDDQAILLIYDRQIRLIEGLTLPELDMKTTGAQGTALYDAIVAAAGKISSQGGRKALTILSDGYDTASSATLNPAIETLSVPMLGLFDSISGSRHLRLRSARIESGSPSPKARLGFYRPGNRRRF